MKKPPVQGWQPAKTTYPVRIPTLDGRAVAQTIEIEIDAWRNAAGELFLDGGAHEKIEAVKARHMGLLAPDEIKDIRVSMLNVTQKEISRWLQIGEKTWTRWESGRERPSRSMNVLLCTLRDGKIDATYLQNLQFGRQLRRVCQEEFAPSPSKSIQYKTSDRAARAVLESLEVLTHSRSRGIACVLKAPVTRKSSFNVSRLRQFVGVAKFASQESPWQPQRHKSSKKLNPRRGLEQTALAELLSS